MPLTLGGAPSGAPGAPPPPPMPLVLGGAPGTPPKSPLLMAQTEPDGPTPPDVALRPRAKLKQMHWDRIEDINQTFWSQIEHHELADQLLNKGILSEVEKVFVAKHSAVKRRDDAPRAERAAGPAKVSFLSRDLAQQFGINLHMFASLPELELVLKVLHCDRDVLNNLSVLEFFCSDALLEISDSMARKFGDYATDLAAKDVTVSGLPSKHRTPKGPRKSPAELDRPDRLFLELCFNLRHYWKSRSRALLMTQTYQKDYADLVAKLDAIDRATASIRTLSSLQHVLAIIRLVGNFMNDALKQAMGFKLATLQRLTFMKDDTNTLTFLHYIERVVRNNFAGYGSFVDELAGLSHIKVSVEQVEADCQEYAQMVANVAASVARGNMSDPLVMHPQDRILAKVSAPLDSARAKSRLLEARLKRTVAEHLQLMALFGENPLDAHSRGTFFSKFAAFVADFKRAHIENVQREEENKTYEARKRLIEARAQRPAPEPEAENLKGVAAREAEAVEGAAASDGSASDDAPLDDAPLDDEYAAASQSDTSTIDTLLKRLKASAPRRAAPRRIELAAEPVPAAAPAQLQEYQSVTLLKSRLSTRRKQPLALTTDHTLLRAQLMLSQLRDQ